MRQKTETLATHFVLTSNYMLDVGEMRVWLRKSILTKDLPAWVHPGLLYRLYIDYQFFIDLYCDLRLTYRDVFSNIFVLERVIHTRLNIKTFRTSSLYIRRKHHTLDTV